MEHTYKQKQILKSLLSKNKSFGELKDDLRFNAMTLTRQLKTLEENGYITHADRSYSLKIKGLDFLTELDPETKGKAFAWAVCRDIELFINFSLMNHPNCFKEKSFYTSLEKRIGEATLFITLKFIEDGRPETLKSLCHLPELLSSIFKRPELSYKEIMPLIADNVLINRLDKYYQQSQEMTPEKYKEMIVLNQILKGKD